MARELVWTGFMSIDGVMDSPGGVQEGHRGGGWVLRTPFDAESYSLKSEELTDTSALLFGRRSYEAFAPFWRESADHAAYRDLPKYVVSTSLQEDDLLDGWGPTKILRTTDEVAELTRTDGGGIFIHGSLELARRLAADELLDRYNVLVFPVLLGAGKTLFRREDEEERRLRLRESAAYANGVIKVVYEVVRQVGER